MKFSGKFGSGPVNKILMAIRITDPDIDPDTYCHSGKTCFGGGMPSIARPSASSWFICFTSVFFVNL